MVGFMQSYHYMYILTKILTEQFLTVLWYFWITRAKILTCDEGEKVSEYFFVEKEVKACWYSHISHFGKMFLLSLMENISFKWEIVDWIFLANNWKLFQW